MRLRKRVFASEIVIIVAMIAAFGGVVLAAQDKYTVKVPNGLAFSEFRGYEAWQIVAVSQSGNLIEVILGNPVMIGAYGPAFPATASISPTAPRWRRSTGMRKRVRRPPPRRCRTPFMTSISW